MLEYDGSSDPTRVHLEDLTEKAVEDKIKAITSACDNPQRARRLAPYDQDHSPTKVNPMFDPPGRFRDNFMCLDLTPQLFFQQSIQDMIS